MSSLARITERNKGSPKIEFSNPLMVWDSVRSSALEERMDQRTTQLACSALIRAPPAGL